jgi:SOS-response transcriptional repressor LexA
MGKSKFNFGLALKEARLRANLSQEELAFQSELDRTYVSMLERNVKAPTLTTLIKLAEALSITPTNLMAMAENGERIAQIEYSIRKEKLKIPFMGTAVSCGIPVTEDYSIEKEISLDDLIRHPKKTFFIKAAGDSMNPTISDGDLLVFELASKAKDHDIVLAQIDSDFTVKRFIKNQTETKLVPDNPLFKELSIENSGQILICGLLVGVVRIL